MAEDSTSEAADDWTESDHASALKHLGTLQDQIDKLRSAIPALVHHFTPPPTSTITPAQLYQDFSTAARQASDNVRKLKEDWYGEASKKIFKHTDEAGGTYDDLEWEFIATARWRPLEGVDGEAQSKRA